MNQSKNDEEPSKKFGTNEDKFKIFRKPTVAQIKAEEKVDVTKNTLVDTIEKLERNQYVVVDFNIVPYDIKFPPRNIRFINTRHFMHHGMRIKLPLPETFFECVDLGDKASPLNLRRQKFETEDVEGVSTLTDQDGAFFVWSKDLKGKIKKLSENIAYTGLGWKGYSTTNKHVQLVNCIEGREIFAFTENSNKSNQKIELREYKEIRDIEYHGVQALFHVMSRSQKKPRKVKLAFLPIPNTDEAYAMSYDIKGTCQCEQFITDIRYRYKTEDIFCSHMIAAYNYWSRLKREETGVVIPQPFPLINQDMVTFWNKSRHQVLKKVPKRDNDGYIVSNKRTGEPRYSTKQLDESDLEVLCWEFATRKGKKSGKGNDATLYTGSKVQEFDWKF